ncbi:MAG: O-antigen ligase family protein [Clostridiales Family XIII bacterium]|jgi:O-antigen ligase|nr:O-antigen ligase family protein [Clostridiales Family XIII bacterium]
MPSYLENFKSLTVLFSIIFIFSAFSRFSDYLGVNIVSFIIVSITFIFFFNNFKANLKNYLLPISLFVLFCVISYYFADFKYNVRDEIFLLLSASGIYLLNGFLDQGEKKKLLIIPVLIGLWLTIYIFVSFASASKDFYDRNITEYMNCTTCFLLLVIPLSFVFWRKENRIYKCMPFIFFIAIIITKSLFAICIASFIFSISFFILGTKIKKSVSAIFALCAITSFYILIKTSFFSDKLLIWKTALTVIRDNFFLGVGFNNYKSVSLSYGTLENIDILYCNNLFLQVMSENGIIGFVLFLFILSIFFFFVIKKLKLGKDKITYLFILLAVISFLFYNFFNSTAFVSTNMLLFFFLLSFPFPQYLVEKRKKKIDVYIWAILFLLFIFLLGAILYAHQGYKKGTSFLAIKNFVQAKACFINAIGYDNLNPQYAGRLSDVYFAQYHANGNKFFLERAIKWSEHASRLARNDGKYYYQLAWLYHFAKNNKKASENIILAIEKDPFNLLYQDACEILLMM